MEEEPLDESLSSSDDESDEILKSSIHKTKNGQKFLSLENDEAADGELNYQIIQVKSVESLKNLKPKLSKVLVVILLKPDDFECFFDEFKSPETIFEVHDGDKINFKRKSSNSLIKQFLGIVNDHGMSFKDKEISLEANCALKSFLKDSLKSEKINTIKTLFNLMNLLNNTCTGLLELLAMSIESSHEKTLSKEVFINFCSVYETEPKALDVKINHASFLEMQLKHQTLNKQWTKYLNKLQYLFDNCNENELFAFLVHTNCHKFLKLFISVYPKFSFDELQKKVLTAMTEEFFDTLKILLDMRGDDDFDINPYKVTMRDVEELFENIKSMNEAKLKQFCNKHPEIKVCRYQNTTALEYALTVGKQEKDKKNRKRFSAFSLLKVNSFKSSDPEDPGLERKIEKFPDEDKKVIADSNIEHAKHEDKNYIPLMESKFKGMSKFSFHEIRTMIKELGEISQIEPMLKIASKNADLKVVVDAESDNVEGVVPMMDKNTKGAAYHEKRIIVLGTDKVNHSHYGHFSHELTHVVMSVVYENKCLPYRKENTKRAKYFDEVFEETRNAFYEDRDFEDIIRWWYEAYTDLESFKDPKKIEKAKNLLKKELIVRPAHMLAEYRNDNPRIEVLRKKYKALFDFFDNHVVPDLNTYLGFKVEDFGLLGKFRSIAYSLIPSHKEKFTSWGEKNKNIVIKTNSPRLALQEFYNELIVKESSIIQVNSKNLFVNLEEVDKKIDLHTKLDSLLKSQEFNRVIFDGTNLPREFVHCKDIIKSIQQIKDLNCFVVVSDKKFLKNKSDSIPAELLHFEELPVSYSFDNLEIISKEEMRNKPLSFQGQDFQLKDLIENPTIDVINYYLDNDVLLDINKPKDEGLEIFIFRTLIKKTKIETHGKEEILSRNPTPATPATSPPSQEILVEEKGVLSYKVKYNYCYLKPEEINERFIILSDFSGAGKTSLLMKHKDELIAKNPRFWISYVALDNFAEAFSDDNFLSNIKQIINNQDETLKRVESKQKCEEKLTENECLASNVLRKVYEVLPGFKEECPEENLTDDEIYSSKNSKFCDVVKEINVEDTTDGSTMSTINSDDHATSTVVLRATSKTALAQEDIEKRLKTPDNLIFAHFFARFILKLTNPVEIAIFLHLYKNNQVILLIDGLNEICSESQKNFLKLCKSFQSLQIWISTTENLEMEVEKKFKTLAYSIKPLTEQEQVDYLVRTLKDKTNECEESLEIYAREIINNFPRLVTSDTSKIISMPLPIRMAAEVYKNGITFTEKFKICDVFGKYLKVDDTKLNRYHQFYALKRIVKDEQELIEIFGCIVRNVEVQDSKILKFDKNNRPFFEHDIFGEFFIADFIGNRLKMIGVIQKDFYNFLVKILNNDDHRLVRFFLNDMVNEISSDSERKWCGQNLDLIFGPKVKEFERLRKSAAVKGFEVLQWKMDEEGTVKQRDFGIMLCASAEGQLNICKFLLNVYKQNLDNKHPLLIPKDAFGRNFLANILRYPYQHNQEMLVEFLEIVFNTLSPREYHELIMECDSYQNTIFHYLALETIPPKIFAKLWDLLKSNYEENLKELILRRNIEKNYAIFLAVYSHSPNFQSIFKIFRNTLDEEALKGFCMTEDMLGNNLIHLSVIAGPDRFPTIFNFIKEANFTKAELKLLFRQKNNSKNTPLREACVHLTSKEIEVIWNCVKEIFTTEEDLEEIEEMIKEPGEFLQNSLEVSLKNKDPKVFRFFFIFLTNRKAFFEDKWKDEVILKEEDLMIELPLEIIESEVLNDQTIETNSFKRQNRPKTLKFLEPTISEEYYTPDEFPTPSESGLLSQISSTNCEFDEKSFEIISNPNDFEESIQDEDESVRLRKKDSSFNRYIQMTLDSGNFIYVLLEHSGDNIKIFNDQTLINGEDDSPLIRHKDSSFATNQDSSQRYGTRFSMRDFQVLSKKIDPETFLKVNNEIVLKNAAGSKSGAITDLGIICTCEGKSSNCKINMEKILLNRNGENYNLLMYAAQFGALENIHFIFKEMRNKFSSEELAKILNLKVRLSHLLSHSVIGRNMQVFEFFWSLFEKCFKKEGLKSIIEQQDPSGDNMVHYSFTNLAVDELKIVWEKVCEVYKGDETETKEHFGSRDLSRIAQKVGSLRNDIVKMSVWNKNPGVFEYTWNLLPDGLKREKVNLLNDTDNLVMYTFTFANVETAKFLWDEIKKIFTPEEIKNLLMKKGYLGRNLLFNSSCNNKSPDTLEFLWDVLIKNIGIEEVTKMIKEADQHEDTILHVTCLFNTKIINELTWRNISKHILKDEASQKEFLFRRGKFNRSVLINSIRNGNEEVFIWLWKKHVKLFRENEEFKSLITELDGEAANVLSSVFVFPTIAKINIVCDEIKARDFDDETIREIFTQLTIWKRNLLVQLTVNRDKSLSVIEHGWKVLEGILGKEEIVKMCTANDAFGYNLLLLSAQFCTKKIFDFILSKIIVYVDNLPSFLSKKNQQGMNVLQAAINNQESLEIFKIIWRVLINKFDKDIKKFLIEYDKGGYNVISELRERSEANNKYKELQKFVKEEIMRIFSKGDQERILKSSKNQVKKKSMIFGKFYRQDDSV